MNKTGKNQNASLVDRGISCLFWIILADLVISWLYWLI